MYRTIRGVLACVAAGLLAALVGAGDEVKRTWTFDDDSPGTIARGFTNETGKWVVAASGAGKVLAQTARSGDDTFNVALAADTNVRDVDLSVRMKAVAGELDQGGGLVWRARDAKNYYLARHNPLENNFRVYKVENGKRTQFQSVDIARSPGWHTIRVVMTGDHITCDYDGKTHLDVHDSTFAGPGKVGLWSKADAQSEFDDLTLVGR